MLRHEQDDNLTESAWEIAAVVASNRRRHAVANSISGTMRDAQEAEQSYHDALCELRDHINDALENRS